MKLANWIWKQLNTRDALDAMAGVINAAVHGLRSKRVAQELRKFADYLERTGSARGISTSLIANCR
jgi:hypothetical protein